MQVEIDGAYAERLLLLARDAGLSRARWVRAAIVAAEGDASIADRITQSAPPSRHGGARPGAGRPPKTDGSPAADALTSRTRR